MRGSTLLLGAMIVNFFGLEASAQTNTGDRPSIGRQVTVSGTDSAQVARKPKTAFIGKLSVRENRLILSGDKSIRKIMISVSGQELGELGGSGEFDLTPYITKAKHTPIKVTYEYWESRGTISMFYSLSAYKNLGEELRSGTGDSLATSGPGGSSGALGSQSQEAGMLTAKHALASDGGGTLESESTGVKSAASVSAKPAVAGRLQIANPQIEGFEISCEAGYYQWRTTVKNRGSAPSHDLGVQAYQKVNGAWEACSGGSVGVLAPGQSVVDNLGWFRHPLSTEYKIDLEDNSASPTKIIQSRVTTLPAISVGIAGIRTAYLSGVQYSWSAQVNNNATYPVYKTKIHVYKRSAGNSWVLAGELTNLQTLNPGANLFSGVWNANGAQEFKLAVSGRDDDSYNANFVLLGSAQAAYRRVHTNADEQTDTNNQAGAQAAAAAQAAADLARARQMTIVGQPTVDCQDCTYQTTLVVRNPTGEAFTPDIIAQVDQRREFGADGVWWSGGGKTISPLANGDNQVTVGWTRELDGLDARVQVTYQGEVIAEETITTPRITVVIEDIRFTQQQGDTWHWEATIRNNTQYSLCYAKIKVYKKTDSWSEVANNVAEFRLSGSGTQKVEGDFVRGGAAGFRVEVLAKKRERYAGYEKIAESVADITR